MVGWTGVDYTWYLGTAVRQRNFRYIVPRDKSSAIGSITRVSYPIYAASMGRCGRHPTSNCQASCEQA